MTPGMRRARGGVLVLLAGACWGCTVTAYTHCNLDISLTVDGDRDRGATTRPRSPLAAWFDACMTQVLTALEARLGEDMPQIAAAAQAAEEYRAANGRWPGSLDDLEAFVEEQDMPVDLSKFSRLVITPVGDGERARMSFELRPKDPGGGLEGQIDLFLPDG